MFVEELDEVPRGATVIFSAHGVSQAVRREAERARLRVFDATCPLVTKVHVEVAQMREGREIVMIGHAGHPEVEGTMGQSTRRHASTWSRPSRTSRLQVRDPGQLAYVTQTTLSVDDTREIVDALKARFPAIRRPAQGRHLLRDAEPPGRGGRSRGERRGAGGRVAEQLKLEPPARGCEEHGRARLHGGHGLDLDPAGVAGKAGVGVTAGASGPEVLVRELIERLRSVGGGEVRKLDGIGEEWCFRCLRGWWRRPEEWWVGE